MGVIPSRVVEDGPFRFRMGTRAVSGSTFLAERSTDVARIDEKVCTFAAYPSRVDFVDGAALASAIACLGGDGAGRDAWRRLCTRVGPDLLLVRRSDLRLDAIAVAFPSGWSPEEALGRSVASIHVIVPGLDEALGTRIERFLRAIPSGTAYARDNWGLALGDALDRHPAHRRAPIRGDEPLESIFLRVEEQAFIGLDDSVLFAVHPVHVDLASIRATVGPRLAAALESMPDDVADYKGLTAKTRIASRLREASELGATRP